MSELLIATLAARLSRKAVLVWLMIARFVSGLPHAAFLAGRVAAYGLMRGSFFCLAASAVILALFGLAAHHQITAVLAVFLLGLVPTILVPMQTRLMDVGHEGPPLAVAGVL